MVERIAIEVCGMEKAFKYRLLDRLKDDCQYYLRYGNRTPKYLWAKNEAEHIAYMKAIWSSFDPEDKPEWISWEDIIRFEAEMVK